MSIFHRKFHVLVIDSAISQSGFPLIKLQAKGYNVSHITSIQDLNQADESLQPSLIICGFDSADINIYKRAVKTIKTIFPASPLACAADSTLLEEVANIDGIYDYLFRPYMLADIEQLFSHHQEQLTSAQTRQLFALKNKMVNMPDQIAALDLVTDYLKEGGYDVSICHVLHGNKLKRASASGFKTPNRLVDGHEVLVGEGLVGNVVTRREAIHIADTRTGEWPLAQDLISGEDLRSMYAVPIRMREDDVIGVLTCCTCHLHDFSPEERSTITDLANLAALEINNANQNKRWSVLSEATTSMAHLVKLKEVIDSIGKSALRVADAQGVAVCFYDDDDNQFETKYSFASGIGADVIKWNSHEIEWHEFRRRLLSNKELLVPKVSAWTEYPMISAELQNAGIHGFIALPLHGRVAVGALIVFYSWSIHPYTIDSHRREDRRPLSILQKHGADVVERAYEHQRKQENSQVIQEWSRLTSMGLPLQGVEAWEELLTDKVLKTTGAKSGAIWLFGSHGRTEYYIDRNLPFQHVKNQFDSGCNSMEAVARDEAETILARNLSVSVVENGICTMHDSHSGKAWQLYATDGMLVPKSRLVTPIRYNDRLLGIIVLESVKSQTFNHLDVSLLDDLASHIGIAIYYDRVLRSLVNSANEFPVIRPIRHTLDGLLTELRSTLQCDIVTLFQYSPYWERFELPVSAGQMNAVAIQYDSDALQKTILNTDVGEILDSEALKSSMGDFTRREQIASSYGLCLIKQPALRLGVLMIHFKKSRSLRLNEISILHSFLEEIQKVIETAYFFPTFVNDLYKNMAPSIVRLHLYEHSHVKWSKPATAGELTVPRTWKLRKSDGPIAHAVNHYRATGETHRFIDDDVVDDDIFSQGGFVSRENIRSAGYVLLVVNTNDDEEEIVGILFLGWREKHVWSGAEKNAVLLYAKQVALGIYNRRQLKQLKERSIGSAWMQGIVGTVLRSSLNRDDALETILEVACTITGAYFGDIRLVENNNTLVTNAIVGSKVEKQTWLEKFRWLPIAGSGLEIQSINEHRIGITVRAFRNNRFEYISDIRAQEDYIPANPDTNSELVVVIRDTNTRQPIGTINLEHADLDAFSRAARYRLIALSDIAAIVLKNLDKDTYLKQAHAVAIRGILHSNWWHTVNQKSCAIRDTVEELEIFHAENMDADGVEKLEIIKELAHKIDDSLGSNMLREDMHLTPQILKVDHHLLETVQEKFAKHDITQIEPVFDLGASSAEIDASPILFDLAIENLLDNALNAMDSVEGKFTVKTACSKGSVEIHLHNNGQIIPERIRPIIFKQTISKGSADAGTGFGALLASYAIGQCNGTVRVVHSDVDSGTTIGLSFPMVTR